MSHASFWVSWAITGAIISAICVLSLIFTGYAWQYEAFLHTNFFVNFMMYFFFSFSMIIYAFFLSTFIWTVKLAYTISYAFVLFAVLLNLILSNSLLLYFIFFNKNGIQAGSILRYVFYFYPPFIFSITFGIITRKASTHFEDASFSFVPGTYFGWSDLAIPEIGEFAIGDSYESPTVLNCFMWYFLIGCFYIVMTWYFDHFISHNRGTNERFYFFLRR